MSNIQRIADSVFRHVDSGGLPTEYALAMGALIDAYDENPDIHEWADQATGNAIDAMMNSMVKQKKWNDTAWLESYVRNASPKQYAMEPQNVHFSSKNVTISSV
ncbi:hypothetical protein ACSSZE_03110 [Acidithiobacillus caldus]